MSGKGIELPDREGRWEVFSKWESPNCGVFVAYRRLDVPPPMPGIELFNGIEWRDAYDDLRRGVVTAVSSSSQLLIVRDLTGKEHSVHRGKIVLIRADGDRIWERDPA